MDSGMKTVLYNYVKSISPASGDKDIDKIIDELRPVKYKRRAVLVKQGTIAYNCYFVIQGCLRLYYRDNEGNEHTSGFFIENDSLTILQSYKFHKPSPYSVECVEDCILIEGDKKNEDDIKSRNPALAQIVQGGLEYELDRNQTEQIRFRSMSPEDRFVEFLESRPGLAARVPQHQLASYLGMSPESLSRIKRRLYYASNA